MNYVWVFLIGYLLGSIPSAVVFSKLLKNDDIRRHGSGNPGTSNMMRTYGVVTGAPVLIIDVLKGLFGALIGFWILGETGLYYGGLMAVVGHNWSIFLKFKGGKGVATSLGVAIAVMHYWAIGAVATFLLVFLASKYASLASLCATLFTWMVTLVFYTANTTMFLAVTLLTVMIFWRHRTNIDRLIKGTETKVKL
jgi:acyl phosphate:glycerol-3-phosphate acyltransferase